jgi:hypothetical protein
VRDRRVGCPSQTLRLSPKSGSASCACRCFDNGPVHDRALASPTSLVSWLWRLLLTGTVGPDVPAALPVRHGFQLVVLRELVG